MRCPRCGKNMREERRTFHKQRKWVCPRCGKSRMQRTRPGQGKEIDRDRCLGSI